jgi:transposase InsO family protein
MPFIDEHTEIQTDNGSEFLGEFKQFLETQKIKQLWNYPRSPKMNAYLERFNRTAQEEFIYQHQHLIRDNLQEFNQKLMRWLIWYNTERPHFSLDLKSPLEFVLFNNQFSKMRWVGTIV